MTRNAYRQGYAEGYAAGRRDALLPGAPDDGPSDDARRVLEYLERMKPDDEWGFYPAFQRHSALEKQIRLLAEFALRAARSPAGTGGEPDDGPREPADASELLAFMPRHHRARTSVENINDTLMALDGWRAGGPSSRPGSGPPDVKALGPFAHFARMWDANPIGGRRLPDDHVVYGIHTGTEWEAHLTLGDFRRAARPGSGAPADGPPQQENRMQSVYTTEEVVAHHGDPVWEAIWSVIREWDISRSPTPDLVADGPLVYTGTHRLYSNATGDDATRLYDAVMSALRARPVEATGGETRNA